LKPPDRNVTRNEWVAVLVLVLIIAWAVWKVAESFK
jgi:general stress protein CsbA